MGLHVHHTTTNAKLDFYVNNETICSIKQEHEYTQHGNQKCDKTAFQNVRRQNLLTARNRIRTRHLVEIVGDGVLEGGCPNGRGVLEIVKEILSGWPNRRRFIPTMH